MTDYDAILARITADAELFRIKLIGYSFWNATHLVSLIEDRGQATVKFPRPRRV